MAGAICPECWDGAHGECIGQGCYCTCQLEDEIDDGVPCPKCCGSGIEVEGWDCWYCDGTGSLDF